VERADVAEGLPRVSRRNANRERTKDGCHGAGSTRFVLAGFDASMRPPRKSGRCWSQGRKGFRSRLANTF
jgi:hypothetical protein